MKRNIASILPVLLLAALAGWLLLTRGDPVPAVRRVLIVSVDGLRPDLLVRGRAPAMQALMRRGSYTLHARTVSEGYTVPSHVSMLTGVVPARHGITWDRYIEDAYPSVPTLFELAHSKGFSTALAVGKTKLIVLTKPGTLDWSHVGDEEREDDVDVAREAASIFRRHHPDVFFVHLGRVDTVGHASGWGSVEQMQAIARADEALGIIEDALKETGLAESTIIILTADHGGAGYLHPPEDPLSQSIPWIAAGPSVRKNFDLTLVPGLVINTTATFATACALLGIDVPGTLDGQTVRQILEKTPLKQMTGGAR